MKIAIIVPSLANKGPVIVAKDISEFLIRNGQNCTLFYFDDVIDNKLEFKCETKKIQFRKAIDFNAYDIIHIHCLRPAIYLFLNYFKISKPILVATLHQPITLYAFRQSMGIIKSILLSLISQISYKICEQIVVLSSEQAKLSQPYFHTRKLTVINNGRNIDVNKTPKDNDSINKIQEFKTRYKVIGSVSVITKGKGLEQILYALSKGLNDFGFVCIGDGPELSHLKKLSQELNIQHRCLWLGKKPDGFAYYKYFDLFIMTTRSEGFPLALIEAAASSCPTVLSNINALKSIISSNNVCFYELDNIESLISNIQKCYDNRTHYSKQINQFYKSNLTAESMGEKYLNLFNNLISQKYDR